LREDSGYQCDVLEQEEHGVSDELAQVLSLPGNIAYPGNYSLRLLCLYVLVYTIPLAEPYKELPLIPHMCAKGQQARGRGSSLNWPELLPEA